MNKLVVLISGIAVFVTAHAFAADIGDIMPSLKTAKQAIDSTFTEIDTDVKAAAKALSATDLKGDTAGLYGTEWRVVAIEISKSLDQPAPAK